MELDQSKLLLIFNVIATTAVTSVTLIHYLRKKDRQKLAGKLNSRLERAPHHIRAAAQPVHSVNSGENAAPAALPAMDWDIRHYVTRRAQGWRAPTVSQRNSPPKAEQPALQRPVIAGDPIPYSPQIVFPRQHPNPAMVHCLAAPLQLCCSAPAARYESLFRARRLQTNG